jgi:hypothetical protein
MQRTVKPTQPPSKEVEEYFIHSYSPPDVEEEISKKADAWCSSHAMAYRRSGKIYSRDIFSDEAVVPTNDIDKFLMRVDHAAIDAVSTNPTMLVGKWLIYVDRKDADQVWTDLSNDIKSGKLPYDAKISTARENPHSTDPAKLKHVVCVYTPNFLWRENVREVRLLLKSAGFQARLYYKPDIFTYLNMYRVYGSKINHRYFG